MGDLFRERGYYFAPTTIQVSLKADWVTIASKGG